MLRANVVEAEDVERTAAVVDAVGDHPWLCADCGERIEVERPGWLLVRLVPTGNGVRGVAVAPVCGGCAPEAAGVAAMAAKVAAAK